MQVREPEQGVGRTARSNGGARRWGWLLLPVLGAGFVYARGRYEAGATALTVTYGDTGLTRLEYHGAVLEDVQQFPADAFHIWHMRMTDLQGNVLAQNSWGEANQGKSWDAKSHTWTYSFAWGTLALRYGTVGEDLTLDVTETNKVGSGVVLQGASFYPVTLHFPALPAGFGAASYPQISNNVDAPGVVVANVGGGAVATVVRNPKHPLFSGFQPAGLANAYGVLISSTTPDGTADFARRYDRPVAPGQSISFRVLVRFADAQKPTELLAADAYANWRKEWPSTLHWPDRRIIGTAYLASSPTSDAASAGDANPRRYFANGSGADLDVRTPAGLAIFQRRVLDQAGAIVQNLRQLGAQGVITWDVEGEQFAQPTSYVGSPDMIPTVAPEMESVIQDATSPYNGRRLDDAYFDLIRSAGFRVGVCLRPQQFVLQAGGQAEQQSIPPEQVADQLIRKARYAHDRWGVTLFYLDSMVNSSGGTLDPSVLARVTASFPDSLFIPEEFTPRDSAVAAPFRSFLFHRETGTDAMTRALYPSAFSAVLVNDVSPADLAAAQPALTEAVRGGDLLMVHADYWQANNPTVLQIYRDAKAAER